MLWGTRQSAFLHGADILELTAPTSLGHCADSAQKATQRALNEGWAKGHPQPTSAIIIVIVILPPLHTEPRPRTGRPHPGSFIISKLLSCPLGCDLQIDPDLSGQVSDKITDFK